MSMLSEDELRTADRPAPPAPQPPVRFRRRSRRRTLRAVLLLLGPLLLLAAGAYFYITGGRYVTTDNAYVKADIAAISAEVSGQVVAVNVGDNQHVEAGAVLFRLDPEPYRLALAQADAALQSSRDAILALGASYRQRQAEIAVAQQNITFYQRELRIYEDMGKRAVVSQTQLDEARHNLAVAREKLPALQQALAETLAELGGDPDVPPERHPRYLAALAARDQAALDLARTEVKAPAEGIVSNVTLRPGEHVAKGQAIFSLVETDHLWVEANFKETDLTHVRPGQTASITIDTYPGVTWKTTVASISPASGAEFALLPPQNSTGNWVKIVQRIPLRLAIESREGQPTLRAGMSAEIEIDTGFRRALPSVVAHALGREQ